MAVPDASPICIPSDDDDSDVEIVKEEKIDPDDRDVIFVSQTSPKIPNIEKVDSSEQPEIQVGTSMQDDKLENKPQTIIPCHRSVSISSDLEMTLSLQDHSEVGAPLDLSARKSDEDSDDSLDSSCESTCTSFSSSDEGSVLNIPSQMDIKTESNLSCQKPTNQFSVCDNSLLTLQTADSSKSKTVTACSSFHPSFDEYISDSLNISYMPGTDMKPIFPTMCKIEPPDKPSCKNLRKSNSFPTSIQSSLDPTGPVVLSSLSHTCNSQANSSANTLLGTHTSGEQTLSQGSNSSPTDLQMQCSAPKKRKDTSPDNDDNDDIWASIRKDLDFLNNLNGEDMLALSSNSAKSLSNCGSDGANTSDKTSLNVPGFHPSDDSRNLTNQNSAWTNKLSQPQNGRSDTVIKAVSNFPNVLTNSSSNFTNCTAMGNSDSKQLPPKKQLRCFRTNSDPLGNTATSSNSSSTTDTGTKWGSEKCSSCMISLLGLKSSRCLQGHVTCGACLEERVKLVLTGKSKESLRCVQSNCDSYYPMSELKHSLPSMVVEILEDKLDNDYIDYIANMIMKNACPSAPGPGSQDKPSDSQQPVDNLHTLTSMKQEENSTGMSTDCSESKQQNPEDWPSNWCKMDSRAGFILVPLKPESPEYIEVAFKFHSTLTFPAADILKISRVQNPILWKYHSVKRLEMIHDNDGLAVEERHLYHGTASSVVDAICRKGFDWRVCGKHGTVYGQGSYFAVEASFSHQYTDKGNGKRSRILRLGGMSLRTHGRMSLASSLRPRPGQLLIPPPAHVNANLTNLIMNPPSGIVASGIVAMQFGGPPMPAQSQGQDQSQVQNQDPNNQGVSNSNMPIPNNMPSHTNSITGFQFNPAVPPPSSVSHQVNSACVTPGSGSAFVFGAPRKRLMGPSTSMQDEPQDPQPVHKMFMSKVLVGKFTGGHAGLRKPPPLYPDTDPYGKCYDSCVDNIMDPKIFVIFDSTQAYPDYLIEYHFTG